MIANSVLDEENSIFNIFLIRISCNDEVDLFLDRLQVLCLLLEAKEDSEVRSKWGQWITKVTVGYGMVYITTHICLGV